MSLFAAVSCYLFQDTAEMCDLVPRDTTTCCLAQRDNTTQKGQANNPRRTHLDQLGQHRDSKVFKNDSIPGISVCKLVETLKKAGLWDDLWNNMLEELRNNADKA